MFGSKKNTSGKQPPISSHPLFPAVVALWFAALLGLGSLVIPVAVFENLFSATGIASLVTAAQAPLGTTARIAIAVVSALLGAGAGLFIARKVVAAQTAEQPARSVVGRGEANDEHAVKPISAHEELGEEGLDEPVSDTPNAGATYSGKRRSLAVTDDSGPSDYLESVPLPGGDPMMDLPDEEELEVESAPLELADLAAEEASEIDQAPVQEMASEVPERAQEPTADAGFEPEQPPVGMRAFDAPQPYQPENEIPQAADDPVAELREELGTMNDQSEQSDQVAYNPFVEHAAEPVASDERANFSEEPSVAVEEPSIEAESIAGKSLGELGMVELVDRFALALQQKAEAKAQAEAEAQQAAEQESAPLVFRRASAAEPAAPFAPSEPAEAGAAVAEFFAAPVAETASVEPEPAPEVSPPVPMVPAALQPLGLDELGDEEDEDGPSLSLSFAMTQQSPVSAVAEQAEPATPVEEQAAYAEANSESSEYSSLLAMKSPFASGQEFVRIDEAEEDDGSVEPAVIFPGSDERRAVPASDGPTRDPVQETEEQAASAPRPFDAPSAAPANGPAVARPTATAGETERALREALEKLQRMSGAA